MASVKPARAMVALTHCLSAARSLQVCNMQKRGSQQHGCYQGTPLQPFLLVPPSGSADSLHIDYTSPAPKTGNGQLSSAHSGGHRELADSFVGVTQRHTEVAGTVLTTRHTPNATEHSGSRRERAPHSCKRCDVAHVMKAAGCIHAGRNDLAWKQ